jgi:hypothetical protein
LSVLCAPHVVLLPFVERLKLIDLRFFPSHDSFWLSEEQILRFLRATKWNEQDAKTRLEKTLIWRREFAIEGLNKEYLSPENETGKQICFGFDNQARPVWYASPLLMSTRTRFAHPRDKQVDGERRLPRRAAVFPLFEYLWI